MRALLVVLLWAVLVVAAACSAPKMSVAEYVEAVEGATDAYIAEAQALAVTFHDSVESQVAQIVDEPPDDPVAAATEVTVTEMSLYLSLLEDAMGRYVDALRELNPPDTLTAAHDEYVAATESVHGAMPATREAVLTANDLDEVQAAVAGSGFRDGQLRFQSSCTSLEQAVRDQGTGVDLGCVREDVVP
ncbi:MAG: hypothetical protein ABFR95_09635 [Actinomycetota bacterium]